MKTTRKEFIKRAHQAACESWKKEIEAEFPKLFKDEIKVGKWYKIKNGSLVFVTKIEKEKFFGCGLSANGTWFNEGLFFIKTEHKTTPATEEEIETALRKEAKKRGFKEGARYNSLKGTRIHEKDNTIIKEIYFDTEPSELFSEYGVIFFNGKWAEIIEEKEEKEELKVTTFEKGVTLQNNANNDMQFFYKGKLITIPANSSLTLNY